MKDSTGIFRHRYKLVKTWICPVMVKRTFGDNISSLGEDTKSGIRRVAAKNSISTRGCKRFRESKKGDTSFGDFGDTEKVSGHVTGHMTRV